MNTIDVCVKEYPYVRDDGTSMPLRYIALIIDGVHIDKPIDVWDIAYPEPVKISVIFPFTCSCGVSGCAGWHFGYKLKFRRNTVEWSAIDPEEAIENGVSRFYSFSRSQYKYVQKRIFELMLEIAEYRETQEIPEDYNPYDYDFVMRSLNRQDMVKEIQETIDWRNEYYSWPSTRQSLLTRYGRCA